MLNVRNIECDSVARIFFLFHLFLMNRCPANCAVGSYIHICIWILKQELMNFVSNKCLGEQNVQQTVRKINKS